MLLLYCFVWIFVDVSRFGAIIKIVKGRISILTNKYIMMMNVVVLLFCHGPHLARIAHMTNSGRRRGVGGGSQGK